MVRAFKIGPDLELQMTWQTLLVLFGAMAAITTCYIDVRETKALAKQTQSDVHLIREALIQHNIIRPDNSSPLDNKWSVSSVP